MIRQLQPGAAIFGDIGPDVRWVGNEEGHAGVTCWATYTPQAPDAGKKPANGYSKYWEATEGTRNGEFWLPAECDVPLRPGWFYHPSQDLQVKSPYQLLDFYYQSVGRGADLDLGLAPNREGRLDEHDVASLKAFGDLLKEIFSVNLARGASFTASNIRGKNNSLYGPSRLVDGDRYSYWATDDSVRTPQLVMDMGKRVTFNVIRLRENIKLGQRIDSFAVDAFDGGQWVVIGAGTSIGAGRLIRLQQNVVTNKVRLRIVGAGACVALSEFGLFKEPEHVEAPSAVRDFGLSKSGWKVMEAASGGGGRYAMAIDENARTVWNGLQKDSSAVAVFPQDISIDMGKAETFKALSYLPRQDKKTEGIADKYIFYISSDGANWQKVAEGEFSNIKSNPLEQVVQLGHAVTSRYFRFSVQHVVAGNGVVVAEVGVR
jgi:alpha-L-fucosidase